MYNQSKSFMIATVQLYELLQTNSVSAVQQAGKIFTVTLPVANNS